VNINGCCSGRSFDFRCLLHHRGDDVPRQCVRKLVTTSTTKQAVRLSGERARTIIEIEDTSTHDLCYLAVDVENKGAVSLVDPSRMDVIVQFPAGNNSAQHLTYVESGSPSLGEWAAASISGAFNPGIFDPGEEMQIDAKLLLSAGDSTGTVTVATPSGVIATASFPAVSPCP